jgi:hypothetical protein
VTVDLLQNALQLPQAELDELLCKAHLGEWTQRRAGLDMSPLHWDWCVRRMTATRLAVVAPREHAKSETFTINGTAWESIYTPGLWTYIFAQTGDQAKVMLARIITVVEKVAPWMVSGALERNSSHIKFANSAVIDVAGAGKAVRGVHPDRIVGDDVLEEGTCATAHQRKRMEKWWFGAIGGMAHPGTKRTVGVGDDARDVWMEPTRIFLVGTPFHQQDLLMGMKKNPVYRFRRYAAEFDPADLVDGMAVEIG